MPSFFTAVQYSIVCIFHSLFIHCPVNVGVVSYFFTFKQFCSGHLVHVSLCTCVRVFLGYIPKRELLGHDTHIFNFGR